MTKKITFTTVLLIYCFSVFSQWTNLNAPNSSNEVYSTIAVSPNGKNIAVYTQKTNTITFQSTYHYTTSHDYGATWQVYSVPDTAGLTPFQMGLTAPQDIFWDGDDLFVQDANPIIKLKKSSNFGATFTTQNSSYTTQSKIVQSPNGKWYHYNASILYSSTDKGISWSAISGAGTNFMEYCFAANGNIVATYNSGVAYSTDGGDSWTASTFSPSGSWVDSKNSISKASDGTLLYLCSTNSKIYKSTDNGVTWQQITSTLPVNPIKMLYSGTDIITLSTNSSTHKSTNGGTSFTQMTPLTGGILSTGNGMANSLTDIFISGMSAIYKYNSTVGISEMAYESQIKIFPNPTSNYLIIDYKNPINYILILNSLGEIIMTHQLIENNRLDLSNFSNGVYFILVSSDKSNFSKKIIVQK